MKTLFPNRFKWGANCVKIESILQIPNICFADFKGDILPGGPRALTPGPRVEDDSHPGGDQQGGGEA